MQAGIMIIAIVCFIPSKGQRLFSKKIRKMRQISWGFFNGVFAADDY
jgi:hypothetical protein